MNRNRNCTHRVPWSGFLCAWLLTFPSPAGAMFGIPSFTIDGGGEASRGGVFLASGTVGQPDAGVSSGGGYFLESGFWGREKVDAPRLTIQREGNRVLVSWPMEFSGFKLQRSSTLAVPGSWADVAASPILVNNRFTFHESIEFGTRLYRLRADYSGFGK